MICKRENKGGFNGEGGKVSMLRLLTGQQAVFSFQFRCVIFGVVECWLWMHALNGGRHGDVSRASVYLHVVGDGKFGGTNQLPTSARTCMHA